jgi:hypothetical protein
MSSSGKFAVCRRRQVSRRGAGCNLIAFLDAFKAIRSLKAINRALKPKVFNGVGTMTPRAGRRAAIDAP